MHLYGLIQSARNGAVPHCPQQDPRARRAVPTAPAIISTLVGSAMMFGSSGQVRAEDLLDIYRLALENDAVYLAAEANYDAAQVDLPLARSVFRPQVSSSGTVGRQRSDRTGPAETSSSNQASVNVDLPLYDRSQRIGVSQAELQEENARIQLAIARDALTLRVANRYFDLLASRDAREVARLQKIAIKRQMDLATERLDVGLGTRTDLFDARARFQQADADVIAAEIAINNARQLIIEAIGTTPESIASLDEDSPLEPPVPNDLDYWVNLARNYNLQVLSEDLNVEVAAEEIDRQRAARYPTVSVGASQTYNDGQATEFSSGESTTTSVGLTVNLPIYLGGAIKLRTRQAGARFNASEQVRESSRRMAASETTSAFLSVTSGISQIEALTEAIIAGESALKARQEGFTAGLTTNLDVLDAQRDLSQSRTDYLRARYNYIIALLRLEQAAGDLGEEDLQSINEWLTESNNSASMIRQDYRDLQVAETTGTNVEMAGFQSELR